MSYFKTAFFPAMVLIPFAHDTFGASHGTQWYDVSEYLLGKAYVKSRTTPNGQFGLCCFAE